MKWDDYFWVTFEARVIFEVAEAIANIGSSIKSNHHNQIQS